MLLVGTLLGLAVAVVLCALLIPIGNGANSMESSYPDGGDDDFFANTDDDSIFYHGEDEEEDPKTITLDSDGSKNIEHLSKATTKSKNITAGCETTVLLMRHCEKLGDYTVDDEGNGHCDYLGLERTRWIPTLFGHDARWPSPSHLYALSPTRGSHLTYREVETLEPLAKKFHLKIHKEFGTNNGVVRDIFKLMSTGKTCGKLIVVNWRHHMMAQSGQKTGMQIMPEGISGRLVRSSVATQVCVGCRQHRCASTSCQ